MDVYLVWGFLGSGKTTLINHLLSISLFKGQKVVVLENESGKESVDGEMLRLSQYTVVDVKGGCVCCTLRMKLVDTLTSIQKEYNPDIVLIEASGLASLEDLRGIAGLSISGILSVMDVTQYDFLMKLNPTFYRRQFYFSSVVFLTKTEQIDDAKMESITEELLTCQPLLHIVPDYRKMNEFTWKDIWRVIGQHRQLFLPVMYKTSQLDIVTETIYMESPVDEDFFRIDFPILNDMFGKQILRAKGIFEIHHIGWVKFDFVNDMVTLECLEQYHGTRNYLSVWWNYGTDESSRKWLRYFLNGIELLCKSVNLNLTDETLYGYLSFDAFRIDAEIVDMINKLKKEALDICSPKLGIRLISGKKIDKEHLRIGGLEFKPSFIITKLLEKADFYVLMLATVGSELDSWIQKKRMDGDLMEAFIADGIGSALAEEIVSYGQSEVERLLGYWDLKVSNSYSPGYCDWNVQEQRQFFSLLPENFCKVVLTESCLMLPIKSVSTLMGAGMSIEKKEYGCTICKNKNCYKRRK